MLHAKKHPCLRGCRRASWRTGGHKTKYSRTNTDKVHGKTKTVAQIESRRTAGSLPLIYYVMCLTFYLKIFPWIICMFSLVFTFVSIVLTLILTICFVWNINKTRKVSLLRYQTPRSLLKNEAISEGFFFNDFWDRIVNIYITYCMFETKYLKRKSRWNLA